MSDSGIKGPTETPQSPSSKIICTSTDFPDSVDEVLQSETRRIWEIKELLA
jgi:hypothetical protein